MLVGALAEDEPSHDACLRALRGPGAVASTHALAEAYANLTGGRAGLRVSPAIAHDLVAESLLPNVALVELTAREFAAALALAAKSGVRGGATYDFLHLAAARKAGADVVLTLDVRDFAALATTDGPRVARPE